MAGCIPAQFSGYTPTGPGTVERRYCAGPGIKDALRIEAESGVRIDLRAGQNRRDNTITLSIRFTVPEAVVVQLRSSELQLRSPNWPQPRVLRIDRVLGSGPKPGPNYYAPTDRLPGGSTSPGIFGLWFLKGDKGNAFQTGLPIVSAFTLVLPPLTIDGETYQFAPIDFEAYEKVSIYTCVQ